jgi:hypothetical protein
MHNSQVRLKKVHLLQTKRLGSGATVALCAWLAACSPGNSVPERQVPVIADSPVQGGPSNAAVGGAGGQPASTSPQAGIGSGVIPVSGTGALVASSGSGGAAMHGTGGVVSSGSGGLAGGSIAGTGGVGGSTVGVIGGSGGGGVPAPTGDVCARWKADRANLSEGTWSGDASACTAGDMTPEARQSAYRLHSLYRFLAGQMPVTMTDEGNRLAQGCALLMTANGTISHMPPTSWKCYTAEAAKTAASSSVSTDGAVASVDGYMIDPGNPTTLGHRRWILSNMLSGVGFGSSGKFSCQYQPAKGAAAGAKAWVAWPPQGQVPLQALRGGFGTSVDQTGWSVQSDSINLSAAQVAVTSAGMTLPVTVTQLGSGYGSTYAISFIPMGWTSAAGKTYHVAISGSSKPIEYDVEVVNCP